MAMVIARLAVAVTSLCIKAAAMSAQFCRPLCEDQDQDCQRDSHCNGMLRLAKQDVYTQFWVKSGLSFGDRLSSQQAGRHSGDCDSGLDALGHHRARTNYGVFRQK